LKTVETHRARRTPTHANSTKPQAGKNTGKNGCCGKDSRAEHKPAERIHNISKARAAAPESAKQSQSRPLMRIVIFPFRANCLTGHDCNQN